MNKNNLALSIKNPLAVQLAKDLSQQTGESITQTIIKALQDRLQKIRGVKTAPDTVEEILAISNRCGKLPDLDSRTPEEILQYNDSGISQ